MSQTTVYTIACPRCGSRQPVELCESINVRENPALREDLMANRLNIVVCAGCGHRFRVDKPLLYHDPERRFMIYLYPAPEEQAAEAERLFRGMIERLAGRSLPTPAPAMHLVLNRVELVERIFLLEAGLDERIIEYVKHSVYTKNSNRLDPVRKRLLFNAQDSTDEHLFFVVQDVETRQLEAVIQYNRAAYRALCETFDDDVQTARLLELFPGPYISARRLLLEPPAPRSHDSPSAPDLSEI